MARWIENVTELDLAAELSRMKEAVETGDESAFTDAFFQDLSFGTAGLRGTLGAGTNRMNVYTVGRATQGFADYLNAHFENPSVAIARDSRNNGELFVRTGSGHLRGERRARIRVSAHFPCSHAFVGRARFGLLGRRMRDGEP